MTYNERCLKCKWLAPKLNPPCGRVFQASMLVGPYGGNIDIQFIPGMVPKEFEKKLEDYLAKATQWLCAVLEKCPIWDEIGELQKENPDKEHCPGRDASENPFLKLIKG